jgi:hypothetical protein
MYPSNVLLLQGVTAEYKSSLLGIEDADNVDADAWLSFISLMQTKTTHIRSQRIIGTVAALLERKHHSVETPYPAASIGGLNRKEAKPGAVLTASTTASHSYQVARYCQNSRIETSTTARLQESSPRMRATPLLW